MAHNLIDPKFSSLIDLNAPVKKLGGGFTFTEGPLWHPVEKHLLFSDMPGDVRRKWTPDGEVTEVMRPSHKGNGMTYDADLNLLVCEHSTSSVTRFTPDGRREVLTSHFEGKELNSPNDICVRSDGAIFFTDPTYGRMEGFGVKRPTELGFQGVYMLPPEHRPGDEAILISDRYMFGQPNGLCLSPCEKFIWVNDTEQANIRMFDIAPDGRLRNARLFAGGIEDALKPGRPDGMKSDVDGNIWVTAPGGVWVYSFESLLLGQIEVPEQSANIHWGGDNWDTLFICATTGLYSVDVKTQGHVEPFMSGRSAPSVQTQSGLRINPHKTALIIQDMQNDVITEGGVFADSGSPIHAREQNVVANSARLAEACRRAGIPVIFVWFICEPGHPAMPTNAPLFAGLKEANALVRGTWGAAPAAGLEPQSGDLIVEKMTMSAWPSSRLESYLAALGIDTIINTGAWTNMSVEHTARTAADKGYKVISPEDACSSMNADWHNAATAYALTNVSEVTTIDAVLAALQ